MIEFIRALCRGWKILTKNYVDVVNDIEKQELELSRLKTVESRRDVYNYLQRLIRLHARLFGITWTFIVAAASLVISIIALIRTFIK